MSWRSFSLSALDASIKSARPSAIALSFSWIAASDRVEVFCSSATNKNVTMVVTVLMISCQVSTLLKRKYDGNQITTSSRHKEKNNARETNRFAEDANRSKNDKSWLPCCPTIVPTPDSRRKAVPYPMGCPQSGNVPDKFENRHHSTGSRISATNLNNTSVHRSIYDSDNDARGTQVCWQTAVMYHDRPGQPQPVRTVRVRSLDGLRGLAAFVVLLHHQLQANPWLSNANQNPGSTTGHGFTWWLTYSPLHLLWDGPQAVYLFFVLSGYVLTLPALRYRRTAWWIAYYPRRLVRLYVPVAASLVFALITVAIVKRHDDPRNSFWINEHATQPHGLHQALHDAVILGGAGWLNSPLWSLRSEVLFSLFFPLYVFVAKRVRWFRIAQILVLLAIIEHTATGQFGALTYPPMFAIGVIMAVERERLHEIATRMGRFAWWSILVVALLMVNSYWSVYSFHLPESVIGYAAKASISLATLGCAIIVFLVTEWPAARKTCESSPIRWLGERSFSLYLTHEPIVIAVTFALGGHPDVLVLLAICTPAALVFSELFFRAVETPSLHLSRWVGTVVQRQVEAPTGRHARSRVLTG
jgi:peptidoglycan/LPS O-acetylase OafA/YrhL